MFRKLANNFQIAYCVITVMNCLVVNYFSMIFHKYSSCEGAFQVNSVDTLHSRIQSAPESNPHQFLPIS